MPAMRLVGLQLNRHRLDADAGTPRVLNALQQTAGLVKVGVKLFLKQVSTAGSPGLGTKVGTDELSGHPETLAIR